MTDAECNELKRFVRNWKEFEKKRPEAARIFWKWRLKHDAAYFAMDFPENHPVLCKKVYPVLLSGKSDDEILAELNKIIPPNFRPY